MAKMRKPPGIKVQATLTQPAEQQRWLALREAHGSDLDVMRWLLGPMREDDAGLPLILGWSEARTARAEMECIECGCLIEPGQSYRRADMDRLGDVYAHAGCVE